MLVFCLCYQVWTCFSVLSKIISLLIYYLVWSFICFIHVFRADFPKKIAQLWRSFGGSKGHQRITITVGTERHACMEIENHATLFDGGYWITREVFIVRQCNRMADGGRKNGEEKMEK